VEERSVDEKADRIAIAQNGQIITINAEQISLFDSTKRRFQAQIPFRGKAIAVNGSEYYILSKSNDVIAIFNERLQLSSQMHFVNDAHDTCNFILVSAQFVYVSCQGAILKLNKVSHMNR
uniref:Uncharacterized protein n=1 Tax=Parascaris univalens TaxID=6257 RepID=A0A915ARX5_PARUN